VRGREPTAERIAELLEAIGPPTTVDDSAPPASETELRWPVTVIALTCLVVVVVGWMLLAPAAQEDPIAVRQRIESDLRALARLIEQYHDEARRYPDAATWRLSSQRGDARFLDPWGRPYIYRLGPTAFSIATYGADQQRGGSGLDMDIELSFPRTLIDGERMPSRSNDEDRAP
jgi:general secretion pathway protein G